MTSIEGYPPTAKLKARSSTPVPAGQTLQVRVLGSTRHGVSIAIGKAQFHLGVPSELSDARTLTLQGIASSSTSGQRVAIVARDDRPLARPVVADLTARPATSTRPASAVVEASPIQVTAQPVSAEGEATGPITTLLLRARAPSSETASRTLAASAADPTGEAPTLGSERSPRMSTATVQQSVPVPHVDARSDHGRASAERSAGPLPPSVALPEDRGLKPISLPAAAPSSHAQPLAGSRIGPERETAVQTQPGAAAQTTAAKNAEGSPPASATRAGPTRSAAQSLASAGFDTAMAKSPAASIVSTYRRGTVQASAFPAVTTQPTPSTGAPIAPDRGSMMLATVVGRTTVGKVILEVADQLMKIEQPLDLPLGTTLAASFVAVGSVSTAVSGPGPSDPATPLAKLIELLADIDRAGRQAAEPDRPDMTRQLPMPDKHLASRLLGLLAAERRDLRETAFAYHDLRGVSSAQKEQIQALIRDLGSAASETLTEGWKCLSLPVGADSSQAICLYVREHALDPDDDAVDGDPEGSDAQRAIFDVSFSQLGRCQIDALCQDRRFDLFVRSERPFPRRDQQDIADLFIAACEIGGVKGEIGFALGSFFEPQRLSASARDLQT